MSVLDILWLLFIISTLQPVIKQRFLEAARQRLIARIEQAADRASSCWRIARRP